MLRELIRAGVLARTPFDERERASIARFVAELDRLGDPFDENADPVHVTASAIVVGSRGVVLHKHRVLGLWLQPGGHIEPGEPPWDAAIREVREETGLDTQLAAPGGGASPASGDAPSIVHVDVHDGPRGHVHLDLRYLLAAGDADPSPASDESQDVRWFEWDEAIRLADPGLRGALMALRPDVSTG